VTVDRMARAAAGRSSDSSISTEAALLPSAGSTPLRRRLAV